MAADASVLSLLGGFRLTVDGECREVPARRVRALACRLAIDDTPLPREMLAGLLWPDLPPAVAWHRLRQALGELRRSLEGAAIGLTVTAREAALETYGGRIDVREFRILAAGKDPDEWRRAMDLYQGNLLEGVDAGASAPFEQWLGDVRHELARAAGSLCRGLAEHSEGGEAAVWNRRRLSLDPRQACRPRPRARKQSKP